MLKKKVLVRIYLYFTGCHGNSFLYFFKLEISQFEHIFSTTIVSKTEYIETSLMNIVTNEIMMVIFFLTNIILYSNLMYHMILQYY